MEYDKYKCELINNDRVEHDLSFKIVIIGNSGNKIFLKNKKRKRSTITMSYYFYFLCF
jgi:hypothetical protein